MSDEAEYPATPGGSEQVPAGFEETGNEAVDEVLRSLRDLDGRPVEEHVTVFESAHETLRATLAGAAEPADRPGGTGRR